MDFRIYLLTLQKQKEMLDITIKEVEAIAKERGVSVYVVVDELVMEEMKKKLNNNLEIRD